MHLIDPHGIYDPPKPFDAYYRENLSDKTPVKKVTNLDPPWIESPSLESRRLLYDGEIRYNDDYFKIFMDKLEEYKLFDDTLIIFIADHGEYLGEHNLWKHHPPGYMQVLHVPLIMVYPKGLPKNTRIKQSVQLLDVMPTILDLANIKNDNLLLQGDSLLSLINNKKLNFWNQRISFSDEVSGKARNDKREFASVFYRNWHILSSKELIPLLRIKQLNRLNINNFPGFILSTRTFNYWEDKEEKHFLNSFFFDLYFKYKIKKFIQELQENNIRMWKTLTQEEKPTIKYDPETLQRLNALGYIQ